MICLEVNVNNVCGMSLSQFNKTIEEMRSIYPFEDNKTVLGNLKDMLSDSQRRVEIITKDEETGITIVMQKGVDNEVINNNSLL